MSIRQAIRSPLVSAIAMPRDWRLGGLAAAVRTQLFPAGEQGWFYDPADLTTLFQDPAGTTPVTAAGQPVGLMLDKRLGAARGAQIWTDAGVLFTGTSSRVSAGVYRIFTADGSLSEVSIASGLVIGQWYEATFTIDSITTLGGGVRVGTIANNLPAETTLGPKRVVFQADSTAVIVKRVAGPTDIQVSNVSFRSLFGNHVTFGAGATRPPIQQDAAGLWHLAPNGTHAGQTASIDLSGTDKLGLWLGINKQSDVAVSVVLESSADSSANAGTVAMLAPAAPASGSYRSRVRGSINPADAGTGSSYPAPITNVLMLQGDIATDTNILRVNGVQASSNTGDQGTGNLGNFPFFLFARAGASLFFNGRFYGGICRAGLPSAAQLALGERWCAARSGILLP